MVDKARQTFEDLKGDIVTELTEMIEIERRSIYLGVNTRNEYNRILDLLSQNTALTDEQRRELKIA